MLVALVVLTVISALVLIAGLVWWLVGSGKTTRRSGEEVGAEIMGSAMASEDPEIGVTLAEKSAFRGTGVAVEREAAVSYAEVKRMVRARQWRAALPPLLAMAGLYGFIVFGVLALWVALDDKLIATIIAAIVLFTMARIAYSFVRS